jgi:predicted metalloprotease
MKWTPGADRSNIEDGRGSSGGFGGGGMRFGRGGMGLGGGAVLLVLSLLFGRNLFNDVGGGGVAMDPGTVATSSDGVAPPVNESAAEKKNVDFVAFVLNDVQSTWQRVLPATGTQYEDAKLRLYRNAVQTACGNAESSVGPFYCPADHRVYIDLSFFDELSTRFGASGDFAQAYVLAHERGHHVQSLMGTDTRVRQL